MIFFISVIICNIKPRFRFYCRNNYDIFIKQTDLNPHYRDGKLEELLSKMSTIERRAYDQLVLSTRDLHHFNFITPSSLTPSTPE